MDDDKNPNNLRRSQDLFDRLAAEEPPIDVNSDTAPSRTAPREAVQAGDTRPVIAIKGDSGGKYVITVALGIALVISLVATLVIFFGGDEDDSDAVVEDNRPTIASSPTPQPSLESTSTAVPTAIPTRSVSDFVVNIPPTAASDEMGAWLLNPVSAPAGDGLSVVRNDTAFTITGASSRLEVIPYTVQQGDTLSALSAQFGLDICSIIWSNPRNKVSPLRPGNVLDIMPVDGVLYKVEKPITIQGVADETGVNPYDIIDSPFNDLYDDSPETYLVEGMKIVVPGGNGGDCNVWAPPVGIVSNSMSGVNPPGGSGGGGGSLWGCSYGVDNPGGPGINPVGGRYEFFQSFSAAHTGVDLSSASGTPVVASGNGTVAFAGWNDYGYGNAIVIDHGGSYTLYGHLSSINVGCGQSVNGGDVIGGVGSTGRSSGPHLHFEIRDGGFNPMNPAGMLPL